MIAEISYFMHNCKLYSSLYFDIVYISEWSCYCPDETVSDT